MPRESLLGRALDYAEDRFGFRAVSAEGLDRLQESWQDLRDFAEEVSELGYHSLDYLGGRPQEMQPERRLRLSQRSRKALREDPLAQAQANLLANFSFGRGVGKPQCVSDKVQEIVDEAWDDPVNVEKLTGFEAQRHRSAELLTQANLYPTAFVRNGRVRIGFLDNDIMTEIVTDPEDDELPLWYMGRKRRVEWDFKEDRYAITDEMKEGFIPKVVYWPHWRHVERIAREAEENGERPPTGPPREKIAEGLVYHVRINRIGRTQFGTPPWAAALRFFSAMNSLTEAHVAMAQAKATWIAKRVRKGGPSSVVAGANQALSTAGELAASSLFGGAIGEVEGTHTLPSDRPLGSLAPPRAGSLWVENEADRLESLNLSSGAGEAATTAQIVRAPIAAMAQFGQHYLGDASDANLATATSLELPTQFNIQAWQETFEQMHRWFVDLVIQEAVRAGRLGGLAERLTEGEAEARERPLTRSERRTLSQLVLREESDKAEMERRTGEDLSYTFEMPYPGRRNLPDVVSTVTGVSSSFDPAGMNVPLRRALLLFLARDGLGVDDPRSWVDEILPPDALFLPGAGGGPAPPGTEPPPPEDERSQYGERTTGGTAKGSERAARAQEAWIPEDLLVPLDQLGGELDALWKALVEDPAVTAAIAVAGGASSVNGSGS